MQTTSTGAEIRPNVATALRGVLFAPASAFAEIDRGARWIWPILVTSVLAIAGTIVSGPAFEVAMQEGIERAQAGGAEPSPEMMKSMQTFAVVGQAVSMPIVALLSALVGSTLLFLTTRSLRVPFKPLFRLSAYTGIVGFGLSSLLGGILTRLRWNGGQVETQADLIPRMGLDLVGGEGWARAFMTVVNPFSIWTAALMVLGVAVLAKKPPGKVAAPVLAGVALGALVGAVLVGWNLSRMNS